MPAIPPFNLPMHKRNLHTYSTQNPVTVLEQDGPCPLIPRVEITPGEKPLGLNTTRSTLMTGRDSSRQLAENSRRTSTILLHGR